MCGVIIFIALLVTFGVVMLSAGFQVLALSALVVGGALLALLPVMKKGMSKMGIALCVVFGLLLIVGGIFIADIVSSDKKEIPEEPVVTWQETFIEHGFTETEVERYAEVLENVGITEFRDITFCESLEEIGAMSVIQCRKVFGRNDLHLQINIENHEIFYIHFTDITDGSSRSVELFYDKPAQRP